MSFSLSYLNYFSSNQFQGPVKSPSWEGDTQWCLGVGRASDCGSANGVEALGNLLEKQRSYLHRHSALSRASSRQTGGGWWEHAATLFPNQLPVSARSSFRTLRDARIIVSVSPTMLAA